MVKKSNSHLTVLNDCQWTIPILIIILLVGDSQHVSNHNLMLFSILFYDLTHFTLFLYFYLLGTINVFPLSNIIRLIIVTDKRFKRLDLHFIITHFWKRGMVCTRRKLALKKKKTTQILNFNANFKW